VNALRPGAQPRLVTRHAYTESGFAWSPNGRRIVYAREKRGGVYVINADGTHDRRLTSDPLRADLLAGGFSWSPDRSGLAFASDRSGNGDIYVMNFLSNDKRQLTDGLAIDGSPRWSP
jgi:TolB protein